MRAGSTNRLTITPDPAADSVTVTLTGAAVIEIADTPTADGDDWHVEVQSDELPTAGTEVRIDWRLSRTVDGETQVRTVTHHEWVEGYDAEPTYSAYRQYSEGIEYDDWPAHCERAWRIADDVTYDRAREELDAIETVHKAIFRIADSLADGTDIVSESHGRYSATFGARQSPHDVARAALSSTGLTYAGL